MNVLRTTIMLCCLLAPVANAQNWVHVDAPLPGQTIGRVQFATPERGCISVEDGRLLRTADGGAEWETVALSPGDTISVMSDPAYAMSFINGNSGWIIGTLGGFENPSGAVIFKTTDGGSTWSKKLLAPWKTGLFARFVNENYGWAAVFTDTVPNDSMNISIPALLRTTDGGETWTQVSDRIGIFTFVDANNGWMVSDSLSVSGEPVAPHEILHTTDGGVTWVSQYRSDLLIDTRIHFTDALNGWVVSGELILHTTDGGANWTPVTNTGILLSEDTRNFVTFLTPDIGWIGTHYHPEGHTQYSAVMHTTDGGATWTTQPVPVMVRIFSISFSDPYNGWLVFDDGSLARMTGGPVSVEDELQAERPGRFSLNQNYPNPFNPSTTISFTVPTRSAISLKVFDAVGREVATLASGDYPAGEHSLQWNAAGTASGVYFTRLRVGDRVETRKLVLMK